VACAPYVLDGRVPDAVARPGSKEEIAAILALASQEGMPVTPWGGGTQMTLGAPPARPGVVIALGRLDRVLEHEPGDLTVTVEAGISLDALQSRLAERRQWLSLDPPDAERASVGGILATNASGPRRHLYGTARDVLIGITMVLGDGSVVRGGGRVVKNVAGYDLPKLAIGSLGTLGVIAEATFKLRPRPDADRLFLACFPSLEPAGRAARAILGSDLIPSAVELIDGDAARALELGAPAGAAILVGVDGLVEQVEWQCAELGRLLAPHGGVQARVLDGAARDAMWRALGGLPREAVPEVSGVMRWSVLPTQVAGVIQDGGALAHRRGLRAAFTAHAGAGVVRGALGGGTDPAVVEAVLGEWRGLARGAGGQAVLEWAPLAVKERVAVWETPGAAHRIMKRIKDALDPAGILNPGRFAGGI
jgi:glycolate oxidase FAD binding subunit